MIKYANVSSQMASWRMLVERHILPVSESCATKYDVYLEQLLAPGTMSLLLAWEPQLKQVRWSGDLCFICSCTHSHTCICCWREAPLEPLLFPCPLKQTKLCPLPPTHSSSSPTAAAPKTCATPLSSKGENVKQR